MQGRTPTDGTYDLHARALAPGPFYIDDFIALLQRQIDGLARKLVELAHGLQGHFAHIQTPLHQGTQFQQAHAQLVQTAIDTLDITTDRKSTRLNSSHQCASRITSYSCKQNI